MELGNSLGMCSPFFPGSATRENWASFPTWCQASFSLWMEIHIVHCSHNTYYFTYSSDSPPMKEPPVSSSHFSSSNIAQIVELNITVEPTLAAAAMHMSASDELFKMNRKTGYLFFSRFICNSWNLRHKYHQDLRSVEISLLKNVWPLEEISVITHESLISLVSVSRYEVTARSLLALPSVKSGNRKKQLAWLWWLHLDQEIVPHEMLQFLHFGWLILIQTKNVM